MKRRRELDDLLDDCLERIRGGERVEDCAGRYPAYRDELVPLLEVAAAAMQVASTVSYRPEAKERGLSRLTSAVLQRGAPKARRFSWPGWRPRIAHSLLVGLVAALLATGTAFGASAASSDSVPGDSLYWVKTTRESISLMVPQSDMDRAHKHVGMARVRGQEMSRLMAGGRFDEAELSAIRMRRHLNQSAVFVHLIMPTNPVEMPLRPTGRLGRQNAVDLIVRLERDGGFLRARLLDLPGRMPLSERHRVDLLRRRSELGYRIFIAALEDGSAPPARPFWRTEPPRSTGR